MLLVNILIDDFKCGNLNKFIQLWGFKKWFANTGARFEPSLWSEWTKTKRQREKVTLRASHSHYGGKPPHIIL